MIKMLILKFLSNLPQPLRDNPWLGNPTNINFKTQFHQQCDYFTTTKGVPIRQVISLDFE